jgi:hypothetical protein
MNFLRYFNTQSARIEIGKRGARAAPDIGRYSQSLAPWPGLLDEQRKQEQIEQAGKELYHDEPDAF